jgi:hypothetical protein
MLDRKRLSFLSDEVQTWQLQAIIGTPLLVPVPRKVMVREEEFTCLPVYKFTCLSINCKRKHYASLLSFAA